VLASTTADVHHFNDRWAETVADILVLRDPGCFTVL
jgi:hypothetical protein